MNAIETLISVLCGPEGKCCISGSGDDRRLIDAALVYLAQAAQPAPATQQGAAYAEVPEKYYLAGGEVPTWDAKQMHAFADATHALRTEQPAAQQPHRSGCTAGTDEECVQRGCGTNCPVGSPRQVVAYAALPEYGINTASHAHFRVLGFTADQMRAFADATHTLRASHGQAPAGESLRTEALCDLSYSHGLKAGWNYCAIDDLAGFERAQKIGTEALRTLKSPTAQQAPAGATAWRSAVLDLIDECPGLTMEQDHWLSRRVKDLDLASAPVAQQVEGGDWVTYDAHMAAMHAFADATHALRASPGQAPAQPDQPIVCSYGDNGYACCEGGPCQADVHNDKLAEQQAPATAQAADSVPAPPPPPECETEAEKRAFAFGWFKAVESERMKADNKKKGPL